MLTKIIIAAILINFSFFITEVIIDAGNIFGAWFYNGIIQTFINAHTGGTSLTNVSLSAGLSTALGVFGLYTPTSSTWGLFSLADTTQSLIGAYIRLAVVAFSSYIFAYVSILFIARTISLLFSLVFSPLGFAGGILPQTKEYADEWWSELIKNVLLAPIFLLFLYIITAFVNTTIFANASVGTNIIGQAMQPATNGFSPVQYFKYFLLAGMLLYALKAAKKQSGAIGKALEKMASQVGQLAVGAATGGAGLIGQLTIGAAASRLAGSKGLNQMVAGGGITGALAGVAQKRITGVADYHFNPAGAALGKETGYNAGKGYNTMMKDRGEQQKKAAESIVPREKEKLAAKGYVETAENEAYGKDKKLGDTYKAQASRLKTAKEAWENTTGDEKSKKYKEYQVQQRSLETIKTSIEKDPESDIREKIYAEEEETLKNLNKKLETTTDNDAKKKLGKEIESLKATMAPEKAALTAEGKRGFSPGISVAKVLSGRTTEEASSNAGKIASKVAQVFGQVLTANMSKLASEQYLKDTGKTAKDMRDATDNKGGKKGKDKDLAKLIADIAGEETEGGGAPAAPSAGPSTPPPASGGPTTP